MPRREGGPGTGPPADAARLVREGIAHHRAGRLGKALDAYERVLAADPDHAPALHLAGLVAHQTGDHARAARRIERAIGIAGPHPDYLSNLAEVHRARGLPARAEACCREAIGLAPDAAGAWNNLGIALQTQMRHDEARSAYERALALAPGDPEVMLNLASLHRALGEPRAAAAIYRGLIARAPDFAPAHGALGIALFETGDGDGAVAALERAVGLDPLGVENHENLKKLRWFRGERERVDESFARACERLPGSPAAHLNYGAALVASGRFAEACDVLARARAMAPGLAAVHDALGRALRGADRPGDAVPAHARAVELAPRDPRFREEAGVTLLRAGDPEAAARELRVAHELDPRRSSALGYLCIALNETGDPDAERLTDLDRLVHAAPIEVPAAFDSVESFNAALHAELEAHHGNPYHPMDQTMRGGTQTRNNLFPAREGLVAELERRIAAVASAWLQRLPPDPAHPFLRFKNPDFAFTGSWSTILRGTGYDGAHVHNEGWMSGTYYVRVPPLAPAQREAHEACLQLGEPPPRFVSARNRARRHVQPREGLVVLFPSYLWHGVRPFRREGLRHAVSFDIV